MTPVRVRLTCLAVLAVLAAGLVAGCGGASKPAAPAPRPARPIPPRNVVMVVFEELSLVQLLNAAGHIDPARYPNFARFAANANFYRNFTAIGDQSSPVTAALLTSKRYRLNTPGLAKYHPHSLFTLLGSNGFGIDASEDVSAFCPRRLCRGAHQEFTGPAVVRLLNAGHRMRIYRGWLASIHPRTRRMLFYAHSALPHTPLEYLPNGKSYREPGGPPPGYLSDETSVNDPWLVDSAWQRALLQVGAVDRMLGQLVARLKATGLYDSSLIVVTADNGEAYGLPGQNRHLLDPATATEISSTPLLVKLPDQQRGRTIDRHLDTYDVLPTVAHFAGVRIPWPVVGRVAGGVHDGIPQRVTAIQRHGPPDRLSLKDFEQQRAELVQRKLARFKSGLYRIGPFDQLVGRRVSSLHVGKAVGLRARLDLPGRYAAFDPRASVVPTLVTGLLDGPGATLGLPMAVAVNGRVAATAFDSGVLNVPGPRFSILLPEKAFRRGANTVRVYAIDPGHGRFRLRAPTPLRSA